MATVTFARTIDKTPFMAFFCLFHPLVVVVSRPHFAEQVSSSGRALSLRYCAPYLLNLRGNPA